MYLFGTTRISRMSVKRVYLSLVVFPYITYRSIQNFTSVHIWCFSTKYRKKLEWKYQHFRILIIFYTPVSIYRNNSIESKSIWKNRFSCSFVSLKWGKKTEETQFVGALLLHRLPRVKIYFHTKWKWKRFICEKLVFILSNFLIAFERGFGSVGHRVFISNRMKWLKVVRWRAKEASIWIRENCFFSSDSLTSNDMVTWRSFHS